MKKNSLLNSRNFKHYVLSFLTVLAVFFSFWIQTFCTQDSLKKTPIVESGKFTELFDNQTSNDLTKTFSSAIESAKESILLIIYTLTDPTIIKALKTKSDEGVEVHVICDAKTSPGINTKLGSNVATTRRFGPGLMHQKILVVDKKRTWIGSANMTTESLRMHGNLVTAIDNGDLAQHILEKASTIKVEGNDRQFPSETFNINGQKIEMWFLPDNKQAINRLKELIQGAKKTIKIAMFTWTRQDLAQSVIDASQRGVITHVVMDGYQGKGASAKIVKMLKKNNVNISLSRSGPLLHHKFLYIDNSILVNGSANWTKAAFSQNDDCFIVMHALIPKQQAHMDDLWRVIHAESLPVH